MLEGERSALGFWFTRFKPNLPLVGECLAIALEVANVNAMAKFTGSPWLTRHTACTHTCFGKMAHEVPLAC